MGDIDIDGYEIRTSKFNTQFDAINSRNNYQSLVASHTLYR